MYLFSFVKAFVLALNSKRAYIHSSKRSSHSLSHIKNFLFVGVRYSGNVSVYLNAGGTVYLHVCRRSCVLGKYAGGSVYLVKYTLNLLHKPMGVFVFT